MTRVKIKECEKPAIEAYWSTLIERGFRNDAEDLNYTVRDQRNAPQHLEIEAASYFNLN